MFIGYNTVMTLTIVRLCLRRKIEKNCEHFFKLILKYLKYLQVFCRNLNFLHCFCSKHVLNTRLLIKFITKICQIK